MLEPFCFFQHDVAVTIPDDVWTPVPYNVIRQVSALSDWTNFKAGSTTITAGSNGQALPQTTINVASTAEFAASGYALIRIGGTDRVVQYTGKTATTLTGCTQGVGTMTTGDSVRQGLVTVSPPPGTIVGGIAEWAWASNATGVRGCRFRDQGPFQLELGGDVRAAVATPAAAPLRSWCAEQPGSGAGLMFPFRIEVYQNSTTVGGLATAFNAASLGYPRLVAAKVSDF